MVHFTYWSAVAGHRQNHEVVELVTWLSFRLEGVIVKASHPKYLRSIEFICYRVAFKFAVGYVYSCIWQIL